MTVTAAEARIEYAGNGTTKIFAYPYKFFQNDDLDVWLFDDTTDIGVEQVLGADYTVTGALNPSGGNVTMVVPPPGGHTLIIINSPDIVQTTHYVNADDFPADSHEQGLDRLTKICQRLSDRIDRAVRAPDYAPEDQVPDADTLVNLVEEAQQAADESAASADAAADSAAAAADSAGTIGGEVAAAAASAAAAATSAANAADAASAADTSADAAADAAAQAQVDKIEWKGSWSSATSYAANDAVNFAGTSYIAKTANMNKQPDTNPAVWDVLAAKGAPGPAGSGTGDMVRANNLSDVVSVSQSRTNLGLGNSATLNVGTGANTVAAGDDARINGAVQHTGDTMVGHLGLPVGPGAAQAVRKDYVDTADAALSTAISGKADAAAIPAAATAAEYLANSAPTKMLTPGAAWGAAAAISLTDAASVAPNLSLALDFVWSLGAAGRTLANPTNGKPGQKGLIFLLGGAGSVTTWGNAWKFPGGVKPTTSASVDIISYVVGGDGTTMYCTFTAGLA